LIGIITIVNNCGLLAIYAVVARKTREEVKWKQQIQHEPPYLQSFSSAYQLFDAHGFSLILHSMLGVIQAWEIIRVTY